MSPISQKDQMVDGFVFLDSSKAVTDEILRAQERKEVINTIAQTTLSVASVSVFCALYPPTISIPIGKLIGAGVLIGVAGEHLRRAIDRAL